MIANKKHNKFQKKNRVNSNFGVVITNDAKKKALKNY